jgi:hypothetical protein
VDDQTVLAPGRPRASLVVRQGTQVGMTFSLAGDEIILGREEGVGISIRDPEISRQHARISWQAGNYYVEDMGSTNGTFLNGAPVTGRQLLRSGDTIGMGQTLLAFQEQAGVIPPQPVAPPARPAAPSPPAEPAAPQKERSRCLLWGCGCLVALGLLLVIAIVVGVLAFPNEIEGFFNSILNRFGLELDLAMLYVPRLLA